MNQVTTFNPSANVPAFVRTAEGNLSGIKFSSEGFKVISLKGKVFHVKDGEIKTLVTKPGTDEPAAALEVVILDIGPSADKKINAKVWYANGYIEGSNAKPDCYSNDGIEPAADAADPQAKKCQLCAKNVWGSGNNGKGTECSSSKRLAIATPDNLDDPMLLRVPAGSLTALNDYLKWMTGAGIKDTAHVVTKIGFDYSVAHPALTFKGLGWATQDPAAAKATDTVAYITGRKAMPKAEQDEPFETEAPAFAQEAPKVEAPKAKAKPAPKVEDDDLPTTPKVKREVQVEGEPAKPAPKAVVVESLDEALDELDLDFDA